MIARQLRIHQWAKNLLIFIPLLASHRFTNTGLLLKSVLAFAAFSCVASSFYVFNDLLDVRADRLHPQKRERPIASGDMSMNQGAVLLAIAAAVGLGLAATVSVRFLYATLAYLAGTAGIFLIRQALGLGGCLHAWLALYGPCDCGRSGHGNNNIVLDAGLHKFPLSEPRPDETVLRDIAARAGLQGKHPSGPRVRTAGSFDHREYRNFFGIAFRSADGALSAESGSDGAISPAGVSAPALHHSRLLDFPRMAAHEPAPDARRPDRVCTEGSRHPQTAGTRGDHRVFRHMKTARFEPFVSVIICTYGRATALQDLLRALEAQTYQNFEVLVVDGNEEPSPARLAIEAYVSHANALRNVALIAAEKGLTRQRNVGLRAAKGDLICFLDDDVTFGVDFLLNVAKLFEQGDMQDVGGITPYDTLHYPTPITVRWRLRALLGVMPGLDPGASII